MQTFEPRRILLVSYQERKSLFARYYNNAFKLANGFIRNGHHVLTFSDRDHAREATIFRSQKFGRNKMQKQLIATARHYQPHLILFGHCDLIDGETYQALRKTVPGVRMAAFCVDALFRDKTMAAFKIRLDYMDAGFITTADRPQLNAVFGQTGKLHFMPNSVDPAIETQRIFMRARETLKYDGQFLGTGINRRDEQLTALIERLPEDYRFSTGGRAFKSEWLVSTGYLERMCEAAVSPNLPHDDTRPQDMAYLYSSDRIAQLLGNGITALSPATSRLSDLYEDGVMEYSNREELAEKMLELYHDDELRRKIGEAGHRLAHAKTNNIVITRYIMDIVFERDPGRLGWNTAPV
ncbi:glycosyltransferase [Martelella mediterranea]|uniref:Glycosyl transferase family 1 n=1 Tax=Martelella mediterranea TaxID=293089 RepID=A0A4R3P457_9HYPH|nr:glycosyltransferase [Martelella mediterranea]TCT43013.1 glycosyl transferase family 1 [Martelella mediterranea]